MFTVLWSDDALFEVAWVWDNADSAIRQKIAPAMRAIDKRLAEDPWNAGESRSAGRRILLEFPLGVLFKIARANNVVHVVNVWTFKSKH